MPEKLPSITGQKVGNWIVGQETRRGTHVAYICTCTTCNNTKTITATDLNRGKNLMCGFCSDKWSSYKEDNLTGTRQGSLTIGEAFRKNRRTYYHVKCDCGKEYDILRSNLIQKKYTNCKCRGSAVYPDRKYGMLQPIERLKNGNWRCLCDCGNVCECRPSYLLRQGVNLSCGCKKKANRVAKRSDNKTGVKGVCFVTNKQKYHAYITKDGVTYRCGFFDTIAEAAAARQAKEIELFGYPEQPEK